MRLSGVAFWDKRASDTSLALSEVLSVLERLRFVTQADYETTEI